MRIVIVGDGKVGSALTRMLTDEGHDLVVIDNNRQVLAEAMEELDVMLLKGNGASLEVQREAEVEHSDLFVAVTSADETNILCCMLARKLGCPATIARVRNPVYAGQMHFLKDELGLTMAVNPELQTAHEIFRQLQYPAFMQRDSFAKGRVEIVQIDIDQGSKFASKKLSDLHKTMGERTLVCAVERGNKVYIPNGGFRLCRGDRIFVAASSRDVASLIRTLKLDRNRVHDVLIVGGGRIAYYLAEELLDAGAEVKIIEKNEERCIELAELLPRAVILYADGSVRSVLDAEGIGSTDAVVTLTGRDEENLIVSMYADFVQVPRVITKIDRMEYMGMFKEKGIATVVSPKELISRQIAKYVRDMRNSEGVSAITLRRIGKMEVSEFRVDETAWHTGEMLTSVAIKEGVLLACINRGQQVIIPRGGDTLERGDTVIVATTADKMIHDLNDIFVEQE